MNFRSLRQKCYIQVNELVRRRVGLVTYLHIVLTERNHDFDTECAEPATVIRLKECNSPYLTTFPEGGVRLRGWVFKCRMPYESRLILITIVCLQNNHPVLIHVRKIIPLVFRRVSHNVIFARAVSVMKVELEEVLLWRGVDIAHGEWHFLYFCQWFPNVEKSHSPRQYKISFIFE